MPAFEISKTPAKPRFRPVVGCTDICDVTYRGRGARITGVWDSRDGCHAWWIIRDGDKELARGDSSKAAMGRWMGDLDAEAELERVRARKPGKAIVYSGAYEVSRFDRETKRHSTMPVHATVVPNRSIRVHSDDGSIDLTFEVGDTAEADSWNLSYLGPIVAISKKTVTIEALGRRRRLTIGTFVCRNHEPTSNKSQRNSEWYD